MNCNKTAIIWEPNDPDEESRHITYRQLFVKVSRFANVLKNNGILLKPDPSHVDYKSLERIKAYLDAAGFEGGVRVLVAGEGGRLLPLVLLPQRLHAGIVQLAQIAGRVVGRAVVGVLGAELGPDAAGQAADAAVVLPETLAGVRLPAVEAAAGPEDQQQAAGAQRQNMDQQQCQRPGRRATAEPVSPAAL